MTDHYNLILPSELYLYAAADFSLYDLKFTKQNLSEQAEKILNYTRLHPEWVGIIGKGYPSNEQIFNDCNETAMFLTDVEAHETYFRLRKNPSYASKVFLSQDTLFHLDYALFFARWVNPRLIRRAVGLKEGGVLEWWTKFFVDFMARLKGERAQVGIMTEEELSSQMISLKGNILVIFVVFCIGSLVSSVVFFIEVRSRMKKGILRFGRKFWQEIRKVFEWLASIFKVG